jgi:hypothetical protein
VWRLRKHRKPLICSDFVPHRSRQDAGKRFAHRLGCSGGRFAPHGVAIDAGRAESNGTERAKLYPRPRLTISNPSMSKPAGAPTSAAKELSTVVVYSEETFQYLLAVERRRMERSGQPFLVLLVRLREIRDVGGRIPPRVAAKIFDGLSACLREVDFVGWYREARVAGAVLAQASNLPGTEASTQVAERMTRALNQRLPVGIAERLRVRVLTIGRVIS